MQYSYFVSGFDDVIPISTDKYGYKFKWINLYDKDDILGWPLKPLSKSYKAINLD